jgi:hypothetical protein
MDTHAALPRSWGHVSIKLPAVTLAVLATWGWPGAGWACQIKPSPDQFPVDATLAASLPAPSAIALAGVSLKRSQHAPPGNGDCGEVGRLTLQIARADGSTWPADIGVRLAVVRGTLAEAFAIPSYPLLTTEGMLGFAGGDDPSQPIDFTLQAAAVNAGGVESSPIEIHVSDGGRGCAIGGPAGRPGLVALAGLVLLGLALARTRERR